MSFRKRHKYLLILFWVCIWLMIKHSTIPYLFEFPKCITFFFDTPKSEFFSETAKIVDVFASAYVTSLLFYYIVDYRPSIKQEIKANSIISPALTNLYLYLSELFALIEYAARQQGVNYKESCEALDNLVVEDKHVVCKRREYINGTLNHTGVLSLIMLNEFHKLRNLILSTCNDISRIPSIAFCSDEIIDILSEIQLTEMFTLLPTPSDYAPHLVFGMVGFGRDYVNLKKIQEKIASYIDRRYFFEYVEASKKEIEEWQQIQCEFFNEHPKAIEAVLAIQKDIKKHEKTNC